MGSQITVVLEIQNPAENRINALRAYMFANGPVIKTSHSIHKTGIVTYMKKTHTHQQPFHVGKYTVYHSHEWSLWAPAFPRPPLLQRDVTTTDHLFRGEHWHQQSRAKSEGPSKSLGKTDGSRGFLGETSTKRAMKQTTLLPPGCFWTFLGDEMLPRYYGDYNKPLLSNNQYNLKR